MTQHPRIVSIQVALPERRGVAGARDPLDRPWTSAIFKQPVSGPVHIGTINLDGDRQADLVHHGGPDKAVLLYSAEHYPDWRRELDQPDLPYGAFGENFTISGLSEADACIGDVYEAGDAIVQVSEPRNPCWKLARKFHLREFTKRVQEAGRAGWYARVIREGTVETGQPLRLVERPNPEWTIRRCFEIRHGRKDDRAAAAALAAVPGLGAYWQQIMTTRAATGESPSDDRRFGGPRPGEPDYAE